MEDLLFPLNSLELYNREIHQYELDRKAQIEVAKSKLEQLEEYFPAWLGNHDVTRSNFLPLIQEIECMAVHIGIDVEEDEEDFQTDSEDDSSSDSDENESNFDNKDKEVVKIVADTKELDSANAENFKLKELRMYTLQSIAATIIESFFCLKVKFYGLAEDYLDKCEFYISSFNIEQDHIRGFQCLIELLRYHIDLCDGRALNSSMPLEPSDFCLFSALNEQESAAFLIPKWEIQELFFEQKESALQTLERLRGLDPKNWVWHYVFVLRKRFARRRDSDVRSCPGDEESNSAIECWKLAPSRYREMCVATTLQCLAEILRFRAVNGINDELQYGDNHFTSNEEIVDFILKDIETAILGEHIGFPELIRYGEMLSSILPYQYRDERLSEQCFTKCLAICPRNSKANHRMGIFHMTKKEGDRKKACFYFERAVKSASSNAPALMDLINLLLGSSGPDDTAKLDDVIQDIYKNPSLRDKDLEKFRFLEGYHLFRQGKISNAAKIWFTSDINSLETSFVTLSYSPKRSLWDKSLRIDWESIFELIKSELAKGTYHNHTAMTQLEDTIHKLCERNRQSRRPRFFSERNSQEVSSFDRNNRKRYESTSETAGADNWRAAPSSNPSNSNFETTNRNFNWNSSQQSSNRYQYNSDKAYYGNSTNSKRTYHQNYNSRYSRPNRSPSPESWR